jgi:hypothetical protein
LEFFAKDRTAINTNNYGAYMQCYSTPSGPGGQCVNFFSINLAMANNSRVWGLNPALGDGPGPPSARTGRVLVGAEFDFTTQNTTPNGTQISGIALILNNLGVNQTSAALQISSIGNGNFGEPHIDVAVEPFDDSGGVPFGAPTPTQTLASWPGTDWFMGGPPPCSASPAMTTCSRLRGVVATSST